MANDCACCRRSKVALSTLSCCSPSARIWRNRLVKLMPPWWQHCCTIWGISSRLKNKTGKTIHSSAMTCTSTSPFHFCEACCQTSCWSQFGCMSMPSAICALQIRLTGPACRRPLNAAWSYRAVHTRVQSSLAFWGSLSLRKPFNCVATTIWPRCQRRQRQVLRISRKNWNPLSFWVDLLHARRRQGD